MFFSETYAPCAELVIFFFILTLKDVAEVLLFIDDINST